jgi:hypothetical protein
MARGATGWLCVTVAAGVALLSGGGPRAADAQAIPRTHLVIISGSSGEESFALRFHELASDLRAAAQRFGIADSLITWLAESTERGRAISGRSTKEGITQAIGRVASRAREDDAVLILLLGHGTSDGSASRFNIPGPDISDVEFEALLDRFSGPTVAVVNAASASGEFVKTLSGRNRVVITATKSGFERNETVFGNHFVAAYAKDGADADKDGRVSLLEAFNYARREVEREYESANKLLTEHAQLDDDANGSGSAEPGERGPDGLLAKAFYLQPAVGATAAADNPRVAELLANERRLQAQLDSLRLARDAMSEADYQKALEDLLLKLSETSAELRALGVRKP